MVYPELTNIASSTSGATCQSSQDALGLPCEGAIDGNLDILSVWQPKGRTPGEWLHIDFTTIRRVVRIDIASLCKTPCQCDRWTLGFSDSSLLEVPHIRKHLNKLLS